MQITLRLDDDLCRRAKARAAAQGISLTKLVQVAIRKYLGKPAPAPRRRRLHLPVSTASGGLMPRFSGLEEAVEAADLAAERLIVR